MRRYVSAPFRRAVGSLALALLLPLGAAADEAADVQRLYREGRPDAAIAAADRFLAENPGNPQMRFAKGLVLAETHQNAEAIDVFSQLITDYPALAEPYNNLAALYAADGRYGLARDTLERAIRANPRYATARENLGDVYAALAADAYARAIALDPGNLSAPPKLDLVRGLYQRPTPAAAAAPPAASAPG